MSAPDIPDKYTINSTAALSGSLDLDLDNIRIKELAPISSIAALSGSLDFGLDNIRIKELAPISLTSTSTLTSTGTMDIGLDDIRIKELPRIDLNVVTAMKPTRVHLPVNLRFGLCTLGVELLAFHVCGESMVVVEDYVPHKTEVCV